MKKLFYLLSFIFLSSALIFSCKLSSDSGDSDSSNSSETTSTSEETTEETKTDDTSTTSETKDDTTTTSETTSGEDTSDNTTTDETTTDEDDTTTAGEETTINTNILSGKTIYSEDLGTKIVFSEDTFEVSEYSTDEDDESDEETSLSANIVARALATSSGTVISTDEYLLQLPYLFDGTYSYTYNAETSTISYTPKEITLYDGNSTKVTKDTIDSVVGSNEQYKKYLNGIFEESQSKISIKNETLTQTPTFTKNTLFTSVGEDVTDTSDLFITWQDENKFSAEVYSPSIEDSFIMSGEGTEEDSTSDDETEDTTSETKTGTYTFSEATDSESATLTLTFESEEDSSESYTMSFDSETWTIIQE